MASDIYDKMHVLTKALADVATALYEPLHVPMSDDELRMITWALDSHRLDLRRSASRLRVNERKKRRLELAEKYRELSRRLHDFRLQHMADEERG